LAHGQTAPVAASSVPTLHKALAPEGGVGRTFADDNYVDSVPGFGGRWLAGFARVGKTQTVVIVQSRYEAISVIQGRLWRALEWAGGLLAFAMAGLFLLPRLGRVQRR